MDCNWAEWLVEVATQEVCQVVMEIVADVVGQEEAVAPLAVLVLQEEVLREVACLELVMEVVWEEVVMVRAEAAEVAAMDQLATVLLIAACDDDEFQMLAAVLTAVACNFRRQ